MKSPVNHRLPGRSQGFTLIEVLIAVLVLSIGLLGLAQTQITAIRNNHSAYLRSQVTILSEDILDSMRANLGAAGDPDSALGGGYDIALSITPTGSSLADQDVASWKNNLDRMLPDGDGAIAHTNNDFTVTVQWLDRDGQVKNFTTDTTL